MNISLSPTFSAILNVLISAVSGFAATQVTTSTGTTTLATAAGVALLNALLHAFSSPTGGPAVAAPPKAK